jgi:hypothetical protein
MKTSLYERAMLRWCAYMLKLMLVLIARTNMSLTSQVEKDADGYAQRLDQIARDGE